MRKREKGIRFEWSSSFEAPVKDVWAFHMRPDALEQLAPSLLGFEVADRGKGVAEGSVVDMRVGRWPLKQRWTALHAAVEDGCSFSDVALEAPVPYWVHCHNFESEGARRSRLTDTVWFVPPRWLPRSFAAAAFRAALKALFGWRHAVTRRHVENDDGSRSRSWCPLRLAGSGGKL